MERREKKARLDSLAELRRIRIEGGSRIEALKREDDEAVDSAEYYDEEDDDEFIEHDPVERKRPTFSAFKSRGERVEPAAGDDYFNSLLSKMDAEVSSSESESEIKVEVDECNDDLLKKPSMEIGTITSAAEPLSSEFAPKEGAFEMDDKMLTEQLAKVHWSDLDEDAGGIEDFLKENHVDLEKENVNFIPMKVDENVDTLDTGAIEIDPTPSSMTTTLPVTIVGEAVDFYWIDAYEKPNGTIFLFGKVSNGGGSFVSCCLTVNGMKRNLFFLPRETLVDTGEEVTLRDVHDEIATLAASHRITKFGCKKVLRKYAFEIADIPVEADYVKMIYPFGEAQLPKDLTGKSFCHVFGVGTSALELFLLKRRIMGPCWLRFTPTSTVKRNVSWCRLEMEVNDPKSISILQNGPEPPTLTVLSLSIRTIVHEPSKTHEVVSASGLIYNNVQVEGTTTSDRPKCNAVFSIAREAENLGFTNKFMDSVLKGYGGKVELAKSERALLGYLIAMIYRSDPDVIVGHNFLGFDLGVLLHRMRACKVDFWSRIGRLNWSQWPKARPGSTEASYAERQITSGRLICDTYLCAKDLVKCRDYSLQTLVETQLQQERTPLDYERVRDYLCTPEQLVYLLRHCEKDAFFQAMLLFQLMVLPLTKQLTAIAGNLWSRTLVGGRAERNELLLLHEFHDQKYICPDKPQQINSTNAPPPPLQDDEDEEEAAVMTKSKSGRRKPTYAGGLVLQPKKGLYDNIVLLLDFNSLYPSIIQEFNICFTTIERDYSSTEAAERMPSPPESGTPQGLLPKILASLVNRRRQIKTMMKDPKISPGGLAQLQIRQQALKLTANSMYGCLGFAHSRFFARPLAMLITAKGREILQHTVDVAQSQCRLDVVYGDTDSIMVHTGTRDLAEARKTGQLLKKAVNEHYRLLEIELDGVFERLLLLKKKKYAAVVLEERADGTVIRKVEIKGLDLVRRDWCALSVDTSNAVLARILRTDESAEDGDAVVEGIHRILREMAAAVGEDTVPLEKYVITKNLTKEPEQYADIKSQPHVAVALQMRERGIAVRAGETIPYVICKTNSGNAGGTLAERAFHPDQVKKEHLVVDKEWYLAQQIHPCVARLCEHLAGTDIARLAGCLGLDSAKYHAVHRGNGEPGEEEFKTLSAFLTDEEKFRNVEKVSMCCPTCEVSFEFRGLATVVDGKVQFVLDCASCGQRIPMLSLYYQLAQAIRSATNSYYMGWLECDEPACRARIRLPRVYEQRCPVDTCRGGMRPLVSGQMLYHQLLYYRSLVDMDRVKTASGMDGKWRAVAAESEPLKELVDRTLSKCAYPIIHLGEIFSFVSIKSPL